MRFPRVRGAALAAMVSATAALLALAGCGTDVKGGRADVVHGKQLFVGKCGACHTLARAGTKGTVGPNLDDALAQSLGEGFKRSVVRGLVREQILYPNRDGKMPAKIYTGQDVEDVAAYVAGAVANPGQDTGALATAVQGVTKQNATAQNGKLEIDADPSGQLSYLVGQATAKPGTLTIDSQNKSSTPHDIAIQQGTNGPVLATGKVVSGGGTSTVTVNLKPGTYTFFCSVPGHRQGGMVGTITVR
jgi:mono/diheme cytochrome c family protein